MLMATGDYHINTVGNEEMIRRLPLNLESPGFILNYYAVGGKRVENEFFDIFNDQECVKRKMQEYPEKYNNDKDKEWSSDCAPYGSLPGCDPSSGDDNCLKGNNSACPVDRPRVVSPGIGIISAEGHDTAGIDMDGLKAITGHNTLDFHPIYFMHGCSTAPVQDFRIPRYTESGIDGLASSEIFVHALFDYADAGPSMYIGSQEFSYSGTLLLRNFLVLGDMYWGDITDVGWRFVFSLFFPGTGLQYTDSDKARMTQVLFLPDGCEDDSPLNQYENGWNNYLRMAKWQILGDPSMKIRVGVDLDRDMIPDVQDNCPADPNLDQADRDNDGIGDVCDNCPDKYNPEQQDSDYDGIGDVCDPENPDKKDVRLISCSEGPDVIHGDTITMGKFTGQQKGDSPGIPMLSGKVCRVKTTHARIRWTRGSYCADMSVNFSDGGDEPPTCPGPVAYDKGSGQYVQCSDCICPEHSDVPDLACPLMIDADLPSGAYRLRFDILVRNLPWFDQSMGGCGDCHAIKVRINGGQDYDVQAPSMLNRPLRARFTDHTVQADYIVFRTYGFTTIEFCMEGDGEYLVGNFRIEPLGGEQ